nr:tRNA-dihydrouridine synthase [Candidatus Sigynarchaeota archaeon]
GVSAITVHGRTRQQLFKGKADWNQIKVAKDASSVPVIGNGDVKSGRDVEAMQRATGCDAVMIGRAAIGHPAIFRKVDEWLRTGRTLPWTFGDQQDDFRRFADSYHEIENDRSTSEFKDHALWFLKGFKGVGSLKDKIRALSIISDIQQAFLSFTPDAHRG